MMFESGRVNEDIFNNQKQGEKIMIGLILAVLYIAYRMIFKDAVFGESFLTASDFLFTWYIAWTIVIAVVMVIVSILISLGVALKGSGSGGAVGAVLGLIGGGAMSLLIVVAMAIKRALLIGGAYLFMTAGSVGEFDTVRLILGGVMLLIGIVVLRVSSSSSSK